MKNTILEKIRELLNDIFPEEEFADLNFNDYLSKVGIDSLSFVQLIVLLEENYEICFEDEMLSLEKIDKINDLIVYVQKRIADIAKE